MGSWWGYLAGWTAAANHNWNKEDKISDNIELPSGRKVDWSTPGKALVNLGNTCYFNVALQVLFSLRSLNEYFTSGQYLEVCPEMVTCPAVEIMAHYSLVLHDYWDTNSYDGYKIIRPQAIFRSFIQYFPSENTFDQNDAYEALTFLLDQLHEALKQSTGQAIPRPPPDGPNPHPATPRQLERMAQESWLRQWGATDSPVLRYLGGMEHSRIQCLSCGYVSHKFTPFTSLTLPFPSDPIMTSLAKVQTPLPKLTLYDLFDNYCHKEQLDAGNCWRCDFCHQRTQAFKRLTFWRLPPYLCVNLKRFELAPGNFQRLLMRKNRTSVVYPYTSLDLGSYITVGRTNVAGTDSEDLTNALYDLQAVIYHNGNRHHGHYTVAVKRGAQWWHYNDDQQTAIKESLIINDQAYVLVYAAPSPGDHIGS